MPLLYFMQAIPVTVVQELSEIVFKDLGIDNQHITQWTSIIALPWTIKLLWGPLVDATRTKRDWTLSLQWLLAGCLALTAFALKLPNAFGITLAIMTVTALFSATCDIATDGYYLLAQNKEQQAANVGIQTAFYRLGRVFVVGLLVTLAGVLHERGMEQMSAWTVVLVGCSLVYAVGRGMLTTLAPVSPLDDERSLPPGDARRYVLLSVLVVVVGLAGYFVLNSLTRLAAHGFWLALGETVKGWRLSADALNLEYIQLAACLIITVFAGRLLARRLRGTELADSFGSFLSQRSLIGIMLFLTFYRFGEAMVMKMAPLFLKDTVAAGGLALSDKLVGPITGLSGVLGLVAGGMIGGLVVSRLGLARSIWPIAILMHLPHLGYIWASYAQPSASLMHPVAFMDSFGYGFGYAAYVIVLQRVAQQVPKFQTAHYAICTGLGALCIQVSGIFAGIVQANFGYHTFYWTALICAVPGILTLLLLPKALTVTEQSPQPV
ncbi:MAG: hypothetical protein JSS72_10140 [Armatimonadetes bacterium]|nr:hypothetical protein [Armatimonadota bacterium]